MLADCQDSVLFHSRNRSIRWVRMVALPTINTVLVGKIRILFVTHIFSPRPLPLSPVALPGVLGRGQAMEVKACGQLESCCSKALVNVGTVPDAPAVQL